MSFLTMYSELQGCIPKLPAPYAKTLINRAWKDVCRQNLWSFQLFEANWVSPPVINAGTVTTVQGSNTVVFDADASTALTAVALLQNFPAPLLQRQFRVGISTIYNIWGYAADGITGIVTLTLDRPYTDASDSGQPYSVYQCYYAAPMQDFLTWINVRDIVNFNDLVLTENRKTIDLRDPQRTIFFLPTHVVYYQQNQNPDATSPGYGCPLFELWGVPQYELVYQLYGIRKGTPLVNDSDTLPPAIGEDCVLARARAYAYEFAEGNKGDMPRNAGSDFRFLMGAAMAEYKQLWREYRRQDRETVDSWWDIRRHRSWMANLDGFYNAIGNTASPGAPW